MTAGGEHIEGQARCDACEHLFTPALREEPDGSGGVVGRFDCPHCERRYEAYAIDARGLSLRERVAGAKSDRHRRHLKAQLKAHVTHGRGLLPA